MTVLEYFNSLPEPYRMWALVNLDKAKTETEIGDYPSQLSFVFRANFYTDIPERWELWEDFETYLRVKNRIDNYQKSIIYPTSK